MSSEMIPMVYIKDIIRVRRQKAKIKTSNKLCFVISCRISGESLFFYNGKKVLVCRGDILYIPYGANYSQECENEEVVCFHLEAYSDLPAEIKVYKPTDAEYICSLFKKCSDKWNERNKNYSCSCYCMSMLYEILAILNMTSDISFQEENPYFDNAKKYLESHMFDRDFTIASLCQKANISRAYFNRLFKEKFDMTPIEFIRSKRIKKAKFLLKSGNYTNEETAFLCGFNDVKYFYAVFKKMTGLTTKDYKRK